MSALFGSIMLAACGGDGGDTIATGGAPESLLNVCTGTRVGGLLLVNAADTPDNVAVDFCVLYSFSGISGTTYTVTVTPTAGDPDLGVAEDAGYTSVIGISENFDLAVDSVSFTAAVTQTYHIIVLGFLSSTYTIQVTQPVWTATSTIGAPEARRFHTAVWTGTEMIVWGGDNGNAITKNTGGRYDPVSDTWSPMTTVGAPSGRILHTAIWTGTEMIIWGGFSAAFAFTALDDGAKYDPQTDSWTPMSSVNAPSARLSFPPVWTGTEMIVWGGFLRTPATGLATGARYNPTTDTWTPIQTANAPSPRGRHAAVWTGSEMIVWGGSHDDPQLGITLLNSGGIYDPVADSWSATSLAIAPAPRDLHVALWSGTVMIVFGGRASTQTASGVNTGGLYDPLTNSWTPTSTIGAPNQNFTQPIPAVWTGTEMITFTTVGTRYDPVTDTWTPTSLLGFGTFSFGAGTAVWTGLHMIVWGGGGSSFVNNTGAIYNRDADLNTPP